MAIEDLRTLPTQVIDRLRGHAPPFAGRVFGAADLRHVMDQNWAAEPSLWVVYRGADGQALDDSRLILRLVHRVTIAIQVDSGDDPLALAPADEALWLAQSVVVAALQGWGPPCFAEPLSFERSGLLADDRARLWFTVDFAAEEHLAAGPDAADLAAARLADLWSLAPGWDATGPIQGTPDGAVEVVDRLSIDARPPSAP